MVYDYIFCGYGLSAALVLQSLMDSGVANGRSILILEADPKRTMQKTWCFWEKKHDLDFCTAKSWEKALFRNDATAVDCLKAQLHYKMIDQARFFEAVDARIKTFPQIKVFDQKVTAIEPGNTVKVITEKQSHFGKRVFNSLYTFNPAVESHAFPLLRQHFTGWHIRYNNASVFDEDTALLMDFSIPQHQSTRFMYVLPTAPNECLVEFTLFSPELLSPDAYQKELRDYLNAKGVSQYEIIKTESAVIPMTAYRFSKNNRENLLHIGTAGGWTKSSTGYTLNNARVKAKALAGFLKAGGSDFRKFHKNNRFYWSDRLFIEVLYHHNALGKELFSRLFLNADPVAVLAFLDEKSTFAQELRIIWACPKRPFLAAVLRLFKHRFLPNKFICI